MPGPGTALLGGPLLTGTRADQSDFGVAQLMQRGTLTHNGTTAVSATFLLPVASVITDITVDTTTAWNSGTSDVLSIGTAAAGTQYASGVDVTSVSPNRVRPTFTAAQLLAMGNVVNGGTVVATVTPLGSASAGVSIVTIDYAQTVQLSTGTS